MPQVSVVEFNTDMHCYIAILTNGDQIPLTSTDLRAAEIEAERYCEQNEFTSFSAPVTWK